MGNVKELTEAGDSMVFVFAVDSVALNVRVGGGRSNGPTISVLFEVLW